MQGILGKHSQTVADATIQDRATNTQGVTNVDKFESAIEPNSRNYSCQFSVNTVYGPTEVQLENYINY